MVANKKRTLHAKVKVTTAEPSAWLPCLLLALLALADFTEALLLAEVTRCEPLLPLKLPVPTLSSSSSPVGAFIEASDLRLAEASVALLTFP